MGLTHFPNDSKPFDITARAFHRINAPNYDVAVDASPDRRGRKQPPSGRARESGARGPEAFKDSGFLANVTNLIGKLLKPFLATIPGVGLVIVGIDEFLKKLTGTSPIEFLIAELGKLISSGVEGGLFARFLRALPAWVPVGRQGYSSRFVYTDDGAPRTTTREEEREIEGVLTGSYLLHNDTVFSQWSHARHWSFQVLPDPGYAYLAGAGNIPDPNEDAFIERIDTSKNAPRFQSVLRTYGQNRPSTAGAAFPSSAVECLLDIGAITKPVGDGGSHGLMFDPDWPYWPMAGDHFWASGRWAYDCMRAVGKDVNEVFPTQINPIKAFAASRFEGFKFKENPKGVPAVRFFFFATTEGGYTEFRQSRDRKQNVIESGITLEDRDYQFIVDLPPRDGDHSPHPIGATIEFPLNRIVLRPRLLIEVRQAPFGVSTSAFADGLTLQQIDPIIEVLRPDDPTKAPTQARITIPLSKAGAITPAVGADKPRAIGLDIALGWHDPAEVEARKLVKVTAAVRLPKFRSRSGTVRMATAVNGRWSMLTASVSRDSGQAQPDVPAVLNAQIIQQVEMFLPRDADVSLAASGVWLHGFGEFIEQNSIAKRRLFVGGVLIDVDPNTKNNINAMINDLRKKINDLRATASDVKNPKQVLQRELQKKIDELKQQMKDNPAANTPATQQSIKALEEQLNALVNGLPDAPDAFRKALDVLDQRLSDLLVGLGALEDFFRITDDLIGERFEPGWHEDIDAAVKTGVDESKRVSAIARSMFLRPAPIINKADEPMGWAEWIHTNNRPMGRDSVRFLTNDDPARFANVATLISRASAQGFADVHIVAPPFTSVGSGNNLARQIEIDRESDYDLDVRFTVAPQIP